MGIVVRGSEEVLATTTVMMMMKMKRSEWCRGVELSHERIVVSIE